MKAKYFTILIVTALLAGCDDESSDIDDAVTSPNDDEVVVADPAPFDSKTDDGSSSPCSGYAVHDQVTIDGETIVFEVPVMCNPYVFDEGDPASDLMQEVMTKQSQVQH